MIDERGGFDESARLIVVHCHGLGILPPVASVGAAMAALLWLEQAPGARADAAEGLFRRLDAGSQPILALKHGLVAGPRERPGCAAVDMELVTAVLQAGDAVTWEADPDFDYEVPADVPGLREPASRALLPRLLYADHDRAYEHAQLVVAAKRRRYEAATAAPGLDPRILAASGWPPRASGDGWRE